MIYLFTALYCEAHGLIRKFGLARNPKNTWLQEFYNQEAGIRLTIAGVGEIAAAAAVGSVCGACRPAREDILLNVHLCQEGRKGRHFSLQSDYGAGNGQDFLPGYAVSPRFSGRTHCDRDGAVEQGR